MQDAAQARLLSRRRWLGQSMGAATALASWNTASLAAPPARPAPASSASASPAGAGELPLRVLLIGNGAYSHNAVLRNPERDTALLARAFQARGAQVQVLSNQSASQLDGAIRAFLQNRSRN